MKRLSLRCHNDHRRTGVVVFKTAKERCTQGRRKLVTIFARLAILKMIARSNDPSDYQTPIREWAKDEIAFH